jgi:hypothetical protein
MPKFQQEKTKSETFTTRAEAEQWAKEEKGKLRQAGFSVRFSIKFNRFREEWEATMQVGTGE